MSYSFLAACKTGNEKKADQALRVVEAEENLTVLLVTVRSLNV
jgi:hypothetical protein